MNVVSQTLRGLCSVQTAARGLSIRTLNEPSMTRPVGSNQPPEEHSHHQNIQLIARYAVQRTQAMTGIAWRAAQKCDVGTLGAPSISRINPIRIGEIPIMVCVGSNGHRQLFLPS